MVCSLVSMHHITVVTLSPRSQHVRASIAHVDGDTGLRTLRRLECRHEWFGARLYGVRVGGVKLSGFIRQGRS